MTEATTSEPSARYLLGGRAVRVDLARVERAIDRFDRGGWTRAALAAEFDVSERTLRRFLAGRSVSAKSLNRILSGLYLDAADVVHYLKPGEDDGSN